MLYAVRVLIDPPSFRRLVRARELLAEDDCPIAAIADEVAISQYHFIRQFAALYGTTPHQFRTAERVARAKQLLSAGRPVTDVCFETGFNNLSNFNRQFRKLCGLPPSEYRRHAKRNMQKSTELYRFDEEMRAALAHGHAFHAALAEQR